MANFMYFSFKYVNTTLIRYSRLCNIVNRAQVCFPLLTGGNDVLFLAHIHMLANFIASLHHRFIYACMVASYMARFKPIPYTGFSLHYIIFTKLDVRAHPPLIKNFYLRGALAVSRH